MLRRIAASLKRAFALGLVLGSFALAACASPASPTLPIPPPAALSSAPDQDGIATITGTGAEPDALVFAFNERNEDGVIGVADASGNFELRLMAQTGDSVSVWQMVGSNTSALVEVLVPDP